MPKPKSCWIYTPWILKCLICIWSLPINGQTTPNKSKACEKFNVITLYYSAVIHCNTLECSYLVLDTLLHICLVLGTLLFCTQVCYHRSWCWCLPCFCSKPQHCLLALRSYINIAHLTNHHLLIGCTTEICFYTGFPKNIQ